MKEIKDAFKKWLRAKDNAQSKCEAEGDLALARKIRMCKMFSGDENIGELVAKMFSVQGVEFMTQYHFPDMETFRAFKNYDPELHGVYIDSGETDISITEPRNIFLVGDTVAHISYSLDLPASCKLVMMHGAKAIITVAGWTILVVHQDGTCGIDIEKKENSIVLR